MTVIGQSFLRDGKKGGMTTIPLLVLLGSMHKVIPIDISGKLFFRQNYKENGNRLWQP